MSSSGEARQVVEHPTYMKDIRLLGRIDHPALSPPVVIRGAAR
jgi:hypothetical protein